VAAGQLANLVIADAGLFREDAARLYEVWVEGERFELKPLLAREPGEQLSLRWHADGRTETWTASGAGDSRELRSGDVALKLKNVEGRWLGLPDRVPATWPAGAARLEFALGEGGTLEGF